MTEQTEAQLQQEVVRLREQQRILELKEGLRQVAEYRYLRILLGQEANQSREKIATQLNSINQQLYDLNKVLASKKGLEVEEEVTNAEEPEVEEEPQEETEEEIEEEPVEEPKEVEKETKEQKKIRKEIEKLEKKISKLKK